MAAEPVATVERHATWKELFFDLVVVAGIGQLAHLLHEDTEPTTLGLYAVLYLAFWISWAGFAVYGNIAGDDAKTRVLITAMLGLAVMAASVPGIHGSRAAAFVIAYVALRWYAGAVVAARQGAARLAARAVRARGAALAGLPVGRRAAAVLAVGRRDRHRPGRAAPDVRRARPAGGRGAARAREELAPPRRAGGRAPEHRGDAHRGGAPLRSGSGSSSSSCWARGSSRSSTPPPTPRSGTAATVVVALGAFALLASVWAAGLLHGTAGIPQLTPHVVAPRIVMLLHALLTGSLAALAAALGVAVEHTHEAPARRSTGRCCAGRWPPTARSAW